MPVAQWFRTLCFSLALFTVCTNAVPAAELLVEAESFTSHGGWVLDTQFIQSMGSPYLLAHGIGTPVGEASTEVKFPEAGTYKVFVRTKDWVARWKAPGTPGRFQLAINGEKLKTEFGTTGADGTGSHGRRSERRNQGQSAKLALHDLTGFDGRCDAIYFTTGDQGSAERERRAAGLAAEAAGAERGTDTQERLRPGGRGGGYSGMGAAISAARRGAR